MNLTEVLESKTYVKEGGIIFNSPKNYLEPFVNIFPEHSQWEIKVSNPVTNQNPTTLEMNTAYPRVSLKAKVSNDELFTFVIGIIYGLDLQKPIMKVYTGVDVNVCTNLTIFNADEVYQQEILGNYKSCYDQAEKYLNNQNKMIEEYYAIYDNMVNEELSRTQVNEIMGNLLIKSNKSKLGTSPIVQASKSLSDNKSIYYMYPNNNFYCTKWNIYNAITANISDNDILSKPSKVVSIMKLIEEN